MLPSHVTLRHYQQRGVDWLGYLHRFGLHGILCDEMGLGKTLQALCMLMLDRRQPGCSYAPSLVVCPSTLVDHWKQETETFFPDQVNASDVTSLY